MADIVIVIRQRLLAHTDFPPARTGVLLAVEGERRCQRQGERLAHGAGIELRVHIQSEGESGIGRAACQSGHAVVLLGVDRGDRECVFEQERVRHGGGSWWVELD